LQLELKKWWTLLLRQQTAIADVMVGVTV